MSRKSPPSRIARKAKPSNEVRSIAAGIKWVLPKPWPEPVNGAALLDELVATFNRHLVLPPGGAEANALWVLFDHTDDVHAHSPRLAFVSPVLECGKTTAMSLLASLVRKPLFTSNITSAAVYRVIAEARPTLLIDEADTFITTDNRDMNGILNSGHSRGATVVRCEGDDYKPRRFPTWAPVVIAKIGALPPTLESRSIIIPMRRRRPDEFIEPLTPAHMGTLHALNRMAARWARDHRDAVAKAAPEVPQGLYNRAKDNWRPLLAIADAAGGHWPETARQVALALSGSSEDPSIGVQLLADIRRIFEALKVDRVPTKKLIEALGTMDDRPWPDYNRGQGITQRQLASLLSIFGIRPKTVRIGTMTPKGYYLSEFEDAFARYLPTPAATAQQAPELADLDAA